MSLITIINLCSLVSMLLLPALAIRQLHPLLSIPIGSLIFWGWSSTLSVLPKIAFSSESIGPAVWLFFGWAPGLLYCLIVCVVSSQLCKSKPSCSCSLDSLALWIAAFALCLCFMAISMHIYKSGTIRSLLPISVGPLLLLCAAMALSVYVNMRKQEKREHEDSNRPR